MVRSSTPNPNPYPSLGTRSMCMTRRSASVHLWNLKETSFDPGSECLSPGHADAVRTRHACISGRCAIQYSPIESSTCTVLPYSCGSKCQLVYACLVRGYGNVYWKGVSKHEKALTRVDLFMGSKQQVAPTGEPPLRGPRLTTAGRYYTTWPRENVRQAGAARRCSSAVSMCRADAIGTDRIGWISGTCETTTTGARFALRSQHGRDSCQSIEPPIIGSTLAAEARHAALLPSSQCPCLASASSTNPAETTRDALWAGQWSTESISCKRDLILLL